MHTVDRWGNSPIDDAVRVNAHEIVGYLQAQQFRALDEALRTPAGGSLTMGDSELQVWLLD